MTRRDLFAAVGAAALSGAQARPRRLGGPIFVKSEDPEALARAHREVGYRVIDTHIHLFDPARPQGVPWPLSTDSKLYRPALPDRLRKIAVPLGISGAIAVECSPWPEDNDWLLAVAGRDTFIVGVVGNLEPGDDGFRKRLERLARNPLFLGIRYGNLWGRDLGARLAKPEFVAGLKALAEAGLSLDTANPNTALIGDILRLTDRVAGLRVVIDHLPQIELPASVRELATRPQVYVKISEVLRLVEGRVPVEAEFYRSRLDKIWTLFGEDRVMFGSDWPNSDQWGSYPQVLGIVREYAAGRGQAAAEKLFWRNSAAAYRWKARGTAPAAA